MGAINIGATNGGRVKLTAPSSPQPDTTIVLPNKSGTLSTTGDIQALIDVDLDDIKQLDDKVKSLDEECSSNTEAIAENKTAIETLIENESNVLHTLSNNTNTLRHVVATKALTSLQFGTANNTIAAGNSYYVNQLYDNENNPKDVRNYEPTKSTMFEIWLGPVLQLRTGIKFWQTSTVNANQRVFNPSGNAPSIAIAGTFNEVDSYTLILTDMKLK